MEYIFMESLVLRTISEIPLTTEYILSNYRDIISEYHMIESLQQEFINLHQENFTEISKTKISSLLSILHKYRIQTHYNKLIEHIIWQILKFEYQPENLCPDIITDIITYKPEFTNLLNYLIDNKQEKLTKHDNYINDKQPKLILQKNKLVDIDVPIKYGLFDVVKYILENDKTDTYITSITCATAARYGQLEILKLLYEKGCPCDISVYGYAAENGHFDILKWAQNNVCSFDKDIYEHIYKCVIDKDHFEIQKWAVSGFNQKKYAFDKSTNSAFFENLKYAYGIMYPNNEKPYNSAVEEYHLEILKNGCEKGGKIDENLCIFAAGEGFFEIIK